VSALREAAVAVNEGPKRSRDVLELLVGVGFIVCGFGILVLAYYRLKWNPGFGSMTWFVAGPLGFMIMLIAGLIKIVKNI
jgi:hypothetical protein